MPKREEAWVKRTYRFPLSLLGRLEREAKTHRRAVNTQLEIALEEWLTQQEQLKGGDARNPADDPRGPGMPVTWGAS